MLVKRIAAYTHLSSTAFTSYSEILVGNCNFSYPFAFNDPVGVFPLELGLRENFGLQKTRIMGLPGSEDSLTIGWAVSTQYQRVMDRRTDVQPAYIKNFSSMTDAR